MTEQPRIDPAIQPGFEPLLTLLDQQRTKRLDHGRPSAFREGRLTARQRVARLLDDGSFTEIGMLAEPAPSELSGAADGVVVGWGTVGRIPVGVLSYDYTVLAGTQGQISHRKLERLFDRVATERCPLIMLSEGGGARVQELSPTPGFGTTTFSQLARLPESVPILSAALGRAFAGHANLIGFSDVVISRKDAAIGMSGPPLVEAATGQRLSPEEIGPPMLHAQTGVVDHLVDTDEEAIDLIKQYVLLLARPVAAARAAPDGPDLAAVVPADSRKVYDVRTVARGFLDEATALELRARFGRSIVTMLGRIDGRLVGVLANQPLVKAGAIDGDASDKGAEFVRLCDRLQIPLVLLVDTPGFMVGADVEKTALVKRSAQFLRALARVEVPFYTVILRKAYGLGYYAMGSPPMSPALCVAWPTAEFGGMGLTGAAAIAERDGDRSGVADQLRSTNSVWRNAELFALDGIIAPSETRAVLAAQIGRLA